MSAARLPQRHGENLLGKGRDGLHAALSTGAVAGITRSTVLKLAEADAIPV